MFLLPMALLTTGSTPTFSSMALQAFDEMQTRYWSSTQGIWQSSMWWQLANTVETVCNIGLQQKSTQAQVEPLLASVFAYTANATKGRTDIGVNLTFSGYFDDEEWWGLAWHRAYELTKNETYLNRSRAIFDDLVHRSWSNASCGGGVCWQASPDPANMKSCYKNAITNELFLSHAAALALTYKELGRDADYNYSLHGWALRETAWLLRSGMINSTNTGQRRARHIRESRRGLPEQSAHGVHLQPGRHPLWPGGRVAAHRAHRAAAHRRQDHRRGVLECARPLRDQGPPRDERADGTPAREPLWRLTGR